MASIDVEAWFQKFYDDQVKLAFQQKGSMLLNSVRRRTGVTGSTADFRKISSGTATTKARHGSVPSMNLDHTVVTATLVDRYAAQDIDDLDLLKHNVDEMSATTDSANYALGRATDKDIIAALDSNSTTTVAASTTGLTVSKIKTAIVDLMANNAFVPGDVYCAVSPKGWGDLMNIDQFVSSRYVTDLPYVKSTEVRDWLGVRFFWHTGLTLSSTTRSCHMWNKVAVGHATGADISTNIWFDGRTQGHVATSKMSMGACLIDALGAVKIDIIES